MTSIEIIIKLDYTHKDTKKTLNSNLMELKRHLKVQRLFILQNWKFCHKKHLLKSIMLDDHKLLSNLLIYNKLITTTAIKKVALILQLIKSNQTWKVTQI